LEITGLFGERPMGHHLVDCAEPGGGGGGRVDRFDSARGDGVVEVTADQVGERGAQRDHARVEFGPGAERLDHEQARQASVATERVEHDFERDFGSADRVRFGGDGDLDALAQHVGQAVEEREEDRLFVWEVEVDAALGGVGLDGDLVDEGAVVALIGEDAHGGIEDALVANLGADLLDGHLAAFSEKPTDSSVGLPV
jgi:hypothetical protein